MFDSRRQIGIWVSFDDRRVLIGGAGVHRLVMEMQVDGRNTLPPGTPVRVTGCCWLVTSGSRDYLGHWLTDKPIALYDQPFSASLVLELRDDQLALIEQRRAKADGAVRFDLEISAALTGGPPAEEPRSSRWPWRGRDLRHLPTGAWPVAHTGHTVVFTPSQWAELLAPVTSHTALVVVMPVPVFESDAHAVGALLRGSLKLVADGEASKAVVDARRAVEMMDRVFGDLDTSQAAIKAIVDTPAHQRTQHQRLALLSHALFSLASPSAHGDEHADTFVWNRETATAVVAAVTALAAVRADLPQV